MGMFRKSCSFRKPLWGFRVKNNTPDTISFAFRRHSAMTESFVDVATSSKRMFRKLPWSNLQCCCFGGLVVSALASGTQVCGFKPGRSRGIFRAKKILSAPSFVGEINPYNYCGNRNCKLNLLRHFSPIFLPFSARGLSRNLCAERAWRGQVKPKSGWYTMPVGCSAHGGETHRLYSKRRSCSIYFTYVTN
jgi:hypothetical protein